MCTRLVELLDQHLQITDAAVAKALGYRGASILWKIRQGRAFVDVEKLASLAKLSQNHARPNIHWLVSGDGFPLIGTRREKAALSSLITSLSRLSARQLSAVEAVIGAFAQGTPRRPRRNRWSK